MAPPEGVPVVPAEGVQAARPGEPEGTRIRCPVLAEPQAPAGASPTLHRPSTRVSVVHPIPRRGAACVTAGGRRTGPVAVRPATGCPGLMIPAGKSSPMITVARCGGRITTRKIVADARGQKKRELRSPRRRWTMEDRPTHRRHRPAMKRHPLKSGKTSEPEVNLHQRTTGQWNVSELDTCAHREDLSRTPTRFIYFSCSRSFWCIEAGGRSRFESGHPSTSLSAIRHALSLAG